MHPPATREVPWTLFDENEPESHDACRHELEPERDLPHFRADGVVLRDAEVDEVGEHDPDGDHDLEEPRDAPPHVFWRAFGDVGGRDGGDGADPDPGDDPP